mgnify:CR=1 FL=1
MYQVLINPDYFRAWLGLQSLKGKVKQRQIVLSNILYTKYRLMSSKKRKNREKVVFTFKSDG